MNNNQNRENQNVNVNSFNNSTQLFFDNSQVFTSDNTSINNGYVQNNYVNKNQSNVYDSNGYVNSNATSNSGFNPQNNTLGIQNIVPVNNLNNNISQNTYSNVNNQLSNFQTNATMNNSQEVKSKAIEVEFTGTNNKDKKKGSFVNLITNKKFLLAVIIFSLIFTSITVGRVFYFKNKVDDYEKFFVDIEYKQSNETIIYNGSDVDMEDLKIGAADELVNCIKTPLNINEIPDTINSIIDEINSYYNQSNDHFSFKYKDIYTGFSVSYNENQSIFVASTIKAPKDIYLYEMASLGKIDLNTKLTYTSNYYNTGSGILRNNKFGTEYTVKELLRYSTVISDNAAHNMLMDRYGRENMLAFWQEKGTNTIFTQYGNWGVFNAHDAIIYMEELYDFYMENETYGQELMNNFLNASPKFINRKDGTKIANKSGWGGSAIHDVSIVFDENPYIIAALSNLGESSTYMNYFNKVNDLAYRLHTEYWKYKMDVCGNINQY